MVAEFTLIESLGPYLDHDGAGGAARVIVGTGDDAAVVDQERPVVVAVDTMVDGVHVDLTISSHEDLGYKAMQVNLSDIAAMGAVPTAAVVSLQRPEDLTLDDAVAIYRGIRAAADGAGCLVVGGDTVGSPTLAVSITILGALVGDEAVLRSGAQVGDSVVLVGDVGLAAAGLLAHRLGLTGVLEQWPELSRAHRRPEALVAAGAAVGLSGVNAAIDVSDGLGRDLGHIGEASGVGIVLDEDRLPRHPGVAAVADAGENDVLDLVLGGGDDYALAVTVPPARLPRLDVALEPAGLRARVIGEVVAGDGVRLRDTGRDISGAGWEHP